MAHAQYNRRGIATLTGLVLVAPFLFLLLVFVTNISTSLYHLLVVEHAMGAGIRQIALTLSSEYGCRQARRTINETFLRYGLNVPLNERLRIEYIQTPSGGTGSGVVRRDGQIRMTLRYDVPIGAGLFGLLNDRVTITREYLIPVERFNARYVNAWTSNC